MSESAVFLINDSIERFLKQTGQYPVKIIMRQRYYDCLLKDLNSMVWLTGEKFKEIKSYKNIQIEIDDEIQTDDLIIVGPDYQ